MAACLAPVLIYTYPNNWVMKDDGESGGRQMAEHRPMSAEGTSADDRRSVAREATLRGDFRWRFATGRQPPRD